MTEVFGNINSFVRCSALLTQETAFLIYMQGCVLRCLHCNAPEMFSCNVNKKMSVNEMMSEISQTENFIKKGGVIVSGGEPLIQVDFVTELFKAVKQKGLKTTLDTSGALFNPADTSKIDILLNYTDIVILSIKHINSETNRKLTGQPNANVLAFAKYLSAKNIPMRINYVAIPTVNSNRNHLLELGEFLATLNNIKSLDVVPFINSELKYKSMNLEYRLSDIKTPSKEYVQNVRDTILDAMRNCKKSGF
ncbi:MAG: radical SAM protein [Candidatus Gastranaerophilales bacterium]|nr:radical SAM protein [Candidatus Gastranaerophilales bacterium]